MIVGRLMVGAGEGSKEGRMQVTGFSNAKNNFVSHWKGGSYSQEGKDLGLRLKTNLGRLKVGTSQRSREGRILVEGRSNSRVVRQEDRFGQ